MSKNHIITECASDRSSGGGVRSVYLELSFCLIRIKKIVLLYVYVATFFFFFFFSSRIISRPPCSQLSIVYCLPYILRGRIYLHIILYCTYIYIIRN